MTNKQEIENFLHIQYGNSGIKGIVDLMQINFTMRNIPAFVTGDKNNIQVDFQKPEMVQEYLALRYIIDNEYSFPEEQLDDAKRIVDKMKLEILNNKQSKQDRVIFIDAGVCNIKYSIGGVFLVTFPIE